MHFIMLKYSNTKKEANVNIIYKFPKTNLIPYCQKSVLDHYCVLILVPTDVSSTLTHGTVIIVSTQLNKSTFPNL